MTDAADPSRSAADHIGAHLLGWKPRPPDERDYALEDYVAAHQRTAEALTADMTLQQVHDSFPLTAWSEIYAFWRAFKALFAAPPAPTPTPADQPVVWTPGPISDQGQTPHCVGYTGLDWGNTLPIDDQWPNSEGNTIYYACKAVDGEPRAEDGSTTRSLFKVLKQMGRCDAYAFTSSVDTIRSYVRGHGPVAIGIPWDNDMFHPDSDGYVHVGGGVAGGHEILIHAHYPAGTMTEDGFVAKEASFRLANHWGTGWARNGFFYMTEATLADRMSQGGDAGAGLELA